MAEYVIRMQSQAATSLAQKTASDWDQVLSRLEVKPLVIADLCAQEAPTKCFKARLQQLLLEVSADDTVAIHWPITAYDQEGLAALMAGVHDRSAKFVVIADPEATSLDQVLSSADGFLCGTASQAKALGLPSVPVAFYGPGMYAATYFKARRHVDAGIDVFGTPDVLPSKQHLTTIARNTPTHVIVVDETQARDAGELQPWSLIPGFSAEAVGQLLPGSYGLIWAPKTLTFPLALTVQLAANQPLIVPAHSVMADFVADNELGIVVKDLTTLPAALTAVDAAKYKHMAMQCERISGLIRSGYYVKRAWFALQNALL